MGPAVWLHGDLHPANVVVRDGALVGLIDFGEMCGGDPATDLSAAWLLPDGAAGRFFDAYGDVDGATIARARAGQCCEPCTSSRSVAVVDSVSRVGSRPGNRRGMPHCAVR